MFFGLLLLISSIEFHSQIYEFIPKKGFSSGSSGSADSKTSQASKRFKRSSDSGRFIFDVVCGNIGNDSCNKAQQEANEVAARLEQVLVLNKSIKMQINFVSFCLTSCSNDTIARTGPTTYFALRDKPTVLYPQSLVKQLATNQDALSFSKYDAVINFNSDFSKGGFRFYFESYDSSTHYSRYSFKFIVSHELMHGLGLVTSFDEYIDMSQNRPQQLQASVAQYQVPSTSHLLSPSPNLNILKKRDAVFQPKSSVASSSAFQFLNVFDTFLVDVRTNSRLNDTFMTYFYTSKSPLPILTLYHASSLYNASTIRYAIQFDTGTETFPMDTSFSEFSSGSTMSHVDNSLGEGALDEMMWSMAGHTRTTDLNGGRMSPLGYYQLRILETMGYKLKIDPNSIPKSISTSMQHGILCWFAVFASLIN